MIPENPLVFSEDLGDKALVEGRRLWYAKFVQESQQEYAPLVRSMSRSQSRDVRKSGVEIITIGTTRNPFQ